LWLKVFDQEHRSHVGPFFGWLNAWLTPYQETTDLKTPIFATTDFDQL